MSFLTEDGSGSLLAEDGSILLTEDGSAAAVAVPATLATVAEATAALPTLRADQLADLDAALLSATAAIEHFCGRRLVLSAFDRVYRPGRTRKIYLPTWPVAELTQLRTDMAVVVAVKNLDPSTNQRATVTATATTLTLARTAAGVRVTPAALTLADYPTAGALAAAVSALGGGWSASCPANLSSTATADLLVDAGVKGALQQDVELRTYTRDVGRYELHPASGVIELTEDVAQAFRYADRAYGTGFGWSWSAASDPRIAGVRAVGRAGYATADADVAAGYEAVPADLKRAAIMAAQAILDATPAPNLESESDGAYSYRLAAPPVPLPPGVKQILISGNYCSTRCG